MKTNTAEMTALAVNFHVREKMLQKCEAVQNLANEVVELRKELLRDGVVEFDPRLKDITMDLLEAAQKIFMYNKELESAFPEHRINEILGEAAE